jgi:hypothetical protein
MVKNLSEMNGNNLNNIRYETIDISGEKKGNI